MSNNLNPLFESGSGYEPLTVANATPEELFDAFLQKVCPDVYDPDSPHMRDTPRRFTNMVRELTDGAEKWKFTTFHTDSKQMVIVRGIQFVSLCAHHVAPFSGVAHVGYIPDGKLAGLSKLARQVQTSAKMLTNQEELTSIIAETFEDILDPLGVAVYMRATHSCMTIRGALAHGTDTVTSDMRGVFADHTKTAKAEFLHFLGDNL